MLVGRAGAVVRVSFRVRRGCAQRDELRDLAWAQAMLEHGVNTRDGARRARQTSETNPDDDSVWLSVARGVFHASQDLVLARY
jgi:hypothetical protein